MNYPKYYGNYLGIVVQNNDPLKRGRVKVFVPHISPTVYKKWNEVSKDKKFRFIGANVCSDITEILEDLKLILPWAEMAAPLAGESASGRFNAFLNASTISDSSNFETAFVNLSSCEPNQEEVSEDTQNVDNIGEKPANIYDISYFKLKDAFSNPAEVNANTANEFSFCYKPEAYSNCAKGAFPLLRVGAHVWVFFNDGDPLKPVVFAASFGSEDWKGIHDIIDDDVGSNEPDEGMDYPGTYENVAKTENENEDINTQTYRNKYVINQKGGTIAFVNTDNKEVLKLTHYSGSFKEFNNKVNIELATGNDQKLVLRNQFLTVRGSRSEFTELDYDSIVRGDFYKKIGLLNTDVHEQWKEKVSLINQIKTLFNIDRASGGNYDVCPSCNKPIDKRFLINSYVEEGNNQQFLFDIMNATSSSSKANSAWSKGLTPSGLVENIKVGPKGQPVLKDPTETIDGTADGSSFFPPPGNAFGSTCKTCGGSGNSPSSAGGSFSKTPEKSQIPDLIKGKIGELTELEKQMGLGGSEIIEITKNKIETIGMTMNDFSPLRVDPEGRLLISEVAVSKYGAYTARKPSPYFEKVQVDDLPGGSYTLNVCNKYNVMVGAGGLNLKSFGIVNIAGAMTNITGMQVNIGSQHEINIDGGQRLNLIADTVSVSQRENKQVVVGGSLGVTHNVTIEGGLHVEGELSCNHLTVPMQALETGEANVYASPNTDAQNKNGYVIGFAVPMSNYATVNDAKNKTYKEGQPKDTGEPYLGFTDASVVAGRIKKKTKIGYLKRDEVIGYIDPTDYNKIFAPDVGGPCYGSQRIPIYATKNVNTLEDVPVLASDVGEEADAKDIPIYGSGPGDDADLRNGTVRASIKGSDAGTGGKDPEKMPFIVYGSGADPDSILSYPHTHTYQTLAVDLKKAQYEVRQEVIDRGDARGMAKLPTNAPQGDNRSINSIEG